MKDDREDLLFWLGRAAARSEGDDRETLLAVSECIQANRILAGLPDDFLTYDVELSIDRSRPTDSNLQTANSFDGHTVDAAMVRPAILEDVLPSGRARHAISNG